MRFFTVAFVALTFLPAGLPARAKAPAPGFELHDQYGRLHRVAFPKARVSVLAFADRAGSEQLEGWVRPLYERYRDAIDIHGVARLAGVPPALRGMLRAIFRRSVNYPVMMDWTGAVSTDYGYEARVANVVVLAPDGRVEYRFNGKVSREELTQCFERIDGLLAAPGRREE